MSNAIEIGIESCMCLHAVELAITYVRSSRRFFYGCREFII